jgi:hypothetical protein
MRIASLDLGFVLDFDIRASNFQFYHLPLTLPSSH